jgi:dUTP pyrophosphatase
MIHKLARIPMELKVKRVREGAILPHYAHPGDAGLDLFAAVALVLEPACSAMVPTGIAIELPPRTEGQVRPRSGLAAKHQITVLNTPGTVDEGYRGEVCVILINHGRSPFVIAEGDKIAQLLVKPVYQVEVVACDELSDTSRGSGGFGSTGSRGKAE